MNEAVLLDLVSRGAVVSEDTLEAWTDEARRKSAETRARNKQEETKHPRVRQTDTPQFRQWFGKSRVVDTSGKPRVVYHGTKSDFDTFNTSKLTSEQVFFFTSDSGDAAEFGEIKSGHGLNVKPVYLSVQNPLFVNFNSKLYTREAMQKIVDTAKAKGHDGVVVYRIRNFAFGGPPTTTFVAFSPNQIKSATGNRGTFDPKSEDINEAWTDEARRKSEELPMNEAVLLDLVSRGADLSAETLEAWTEHARELSAETRRRNAEMHNAVSEKLGRPHRPGTRPISRRQRQENANELVRQFSSEKERLAPINRPAGQQPAERPAQPQPAAPPQEENIDVEKIARVGGPDAVLRTIATEKEQANPTSRPAPAPTPAQPTSDPTQGMMRLRTPGRAAVRAAGGTHVAGYNPKPMNMEKEGIGNYTTTFSVGDVPFRARAYKDYNNEWDFDFRDTSEGYGFGITGKLKGKAIELFRKVGGALDSFVSQERPRRFYFLANLSEESRVDLYGRAAALIARRHGYKVKAETRSHPGYKTFTLIKDPSVQESLDVLESWDEAFDREFASEIALYTDLEMRGF
ncbi:MAG: hypothetical protein WC378_00095 [Opitutaceae bacterium]|jgi:hypothetical protein